MCAVRKRRKSLLLLMFSVLGTTLVGCAGGDNLARAHLWPVTGSYNVLKETFEKEDDDPPPPLPTTPIDEEEPESDDPCDSGCDEDDDYDEYVEIEIVEADHGSQVLAPFEADQ